MGEPPAIDVASFLADSQAELERCAHAHWYAEGLDLAGRTMPWVLHADQVKAVLRDRRLSSRSFVEDMRASGMTQESTEQLTPLFRRDGEEHRRHRALLAAAFTPRSVERLRPVSAELAARLADELAAAPGPAPFVVTFAATLPAEVFAHLFGLPTDDRDRVARWSGSVALAFTAGATPAQVDEIEAAAAALRSYCRELIALRREQPADDLITHLLEVEVDGHRLDEREVVATMSGFIFAGSETTRRQLTAMVLAFAEHPDEWARVADDPELIPLAVEEVLRHRGIVPGLTRATIEPFEHEGLRLDVGDRLFASFEAANHDAAVFDDPHRFDIGRTNAAEHVAFGWGPHFCLGAGLARVELQESLRVLVDRFDAPVVVDDGSGGPTSFTVPDEIVVRFPPR